MPDLLFLLLAGAALGAEPYSALAPSPDLGAPPVVAEPAPEWDSHLAEGCPAASDRPRGLFESDHAFPRFVGPISNPVLTKDPRSLTEARLLFVSDYIPSDHPFGGGDFQVYGLEARVALTERLTFIADKDGIASIHAHNMRSETGLLNIAVGAKYVLIRDVEDQFLVTTGLMYEPPNGEAKVFQGQGSGVFTTFLSTGKEFAEVYHFLGNFGYQFPADTNQNSSFFYSQVHLDRQVAGWLYPLVEFNWFHYTQGGQHGLPPALGEGDGLINLGTTGVAGNDLVTFAVGLKVHCGPHLDLGTAYEVPLSNRQDLLGNRLLAELILRY
jgi:hypothetical protein